MNKNHSLSFQLFRSNVEAIFDLPMYLVVTIIIGLIVISGIFALMVNPSFVNPHPTITITPMITTIAANNTSIDYSIVLQTTDNQPISHAHVIIRNNRVIATNITNATGGATISLIACIPKGLHEMYFDVIIKSDKYDTITRNDMLKVVLRR